MPNRHQLSLLLFSLCTSCAGSPWGSRMPGLDALRGPGMALPSSESALERAKIGVAPRIGAPGGSGAGARRVTPGQSGKDTVGGLPAGMGGGTARGGRG